MYRCEIVFVPVPACRLPASKSPKAAKCHPRPEELLVSVRRSGQTSQLSTPTASCRVSRAPLASLALANYEPLKGSLAVDLPVLKKERNPESIPVRTTGVDARCECKGRVKIVSASGILAHQRMRAPRHRLPSNPSGRGVHQCAVACSSCSYLFLFNRDLCLPACSAVDDGRCEWSAVSGAAIRFPPVFAARDRCGGAALVSCETFISFQPGGRASRRVNAQRR
jgi:hypothetical protein